MAMRALKLKQPEPDPAEDALAFAGGLLAGALIGALIAIFLAPSDGQTIRRRLKSQLGMGDGDDSAGRSTGADDPLLTPRNVAGEEGVAEQRLPAYSH